MIANCRKGPLSANHDLKKNYTVFLETIQFLVIAVSRNYPAVPLPTALRNDMILPTYAKLGQIPVNVTLNIELFIFVMHFDHFLKECNNINSWLKLKHDLFSQILDLGCNFCQVNELFETLSTSNVISRI